ncbi:DNA repair helicase [Ancylostoma caninum]|uniref:DNA repair helicase n=1 Tax=Ancylostoma caninum TaxID=29170 RepID=A0A368GTX1_ANCCA|nr:DNA repair helicase [Ancylostoma caninum]
MDEFSFPFPPYDIQLNLMREIKQCIANEQVGIFESPTGTGKSLSVLCATMTWLEEFEKETEEALIRDSNLKESVEDSDWMAAYKKKLEIMKIKDEAYDKLKSIEKIKSRLADAKAGLVKRDRKRRHADTQSSEGSKNEEDLEECAPPDDYASDEEIGSEKEESLKVVKVFYASRTHSQLEQLLDELKKTRFAPRVITAASRQALCANENVRRLKFSHLINEKCMELRKGCSTEGKRAKIDGKENCSTSKKSSCKCPYYKSDSIEELSNEVLAGGGTWKTACCLSIFCNEIVRAAVPTSFVTLSGALYSAEVTSISTTLALSLIREYIDTYRSRLKAKNLMYVKQILAVVAAMDHYLHKSINGADELGLTDVNLFKLVHYMDATDMCRKFHGFYVRSMKSKVNVAKQPAPQSGIAKLLAAKKPVNPTPAQTVDDKDRTYPSPLFTIKGFLEALSNRCEDGRIIVERKGAVVKFRFILLNPASRLVEVVKEARATVLIGGTMEPSGLLVDCLSRGGVENGIRRFTCSHVIDDHQLLALSIGQHVRNERFTLTYESRSDVQCLRSVAETLLRLAGEVPHGCVAFFTSYDYLAQFLSLIEKDGIVKKCQFKKALFVEARGGSADVWDRFTSAVRVGNGAILFAVAGGKLSEGINFSDELGRAVFMVGMPYPNRNSVELREKMKYLDSQISGGGSQLYQSLCMHTINQAIGRAIRHRNDYAVVYLLDSRFTRNDVISKLPAWISKRLKCPNSFAEAAALTKAFFREKNGK